MGLKGEKMTVSEVLSLTLQNLSREDVLETDLFDENGQEATDEQEELVSDLIKCLNDTIQSIVYVYHPLKTKEEISVLNKTFLFNNLSKTIIDVLKLKNKNLVNCPFQIFPTYLECENGNYTITYTYQPEEVSGLDDEIDIPQGKVTSRILATGCTSRFFLKRGMYQDANVWDVSFQRLMLVGKHPKNVPEIAPRGWF